MADTEKTKEQIAEQPIHHEGVRTINDDIEQAKITGAMKEPTRTEAQAVHTLSSDLTNALYAKKGTVIKVALAEEEKRRMLDQGRALYSKQNIFFIVASIIFVLAGLGLITFFLIKQNPTANTNTQTVTLPAYIFTDGNITVSLTDKTKEESRALIASAVASIQSNETVVGIYPMYTINETEQLVSFSQFNTILALDIPPTVMSNFIGAFMIGSHRSSDSVVPFLVLKTISEENARVAMFAWESTLYDAGVKSFGLESKLSLVDKSFENTIIRNKDARVLRDENGEIVLIYTFLDKQTLIITTKPDTIALAIERLNLERIIK